MPDSDAANAPLLIGVDAGTTQIRALVFTVDGQLVAKGSAPTPTERPQPHWAQHDPQAFWAALVTALRQALGQVNDINRVMGIAIASVGEAAVPVDSHDRPMFPAIAWFDERTKAQAEWLRAQLGVERLFQTTGLHLDPMFGLCKLLWLKQHQPDAFRRTARWLHMADYLAWRLCGVAATDYSLASRTLALDLADLRWSNELLDEIGIPKSILQPLRPSGSRLGTVTAAAARETGLPMHCVVGVGGHDHIVGALAAGAWQAGTLLDSLGTAEALLLAQDRPVFDSLLPECGYSQGALVVDRPRYYVVASMTTSGACVEWFREVIAGSAGHDELIAAAERVPAGSFGARFFPQMRVGAPPHRIPSSRGALFGLSPDHSRAALYRALLEGLAYDAYYAVSSLVELPDVPAVKRILAIGGDSRNRLLMQIKAAVHRQPIAIVDLSEAVSLGAALLAGLAAGLYADIDEALSQIDSASHTVEPESADVAAYIDLAASYNRVPVLMDELHNA